jgi:hypothetical protein
MVEDYNSTKSISKGGTKSEEILKDFPLYIYGHHTKCDENLGF